MGCEKETKMEVNPQLEELQSGESTSSFLEKWQSKKVLKKEKENKRRKRRSLNLQDTVIQMLYVVFWFDFLSLPLS